MRRINGSELMSDFNFTSKYAKFDSDKKRREVWEESIDRMRNMHLFKYEKRGSDVLANINDAFQYVVDKSLPPFRNYLLYN